MFFFNDTATTWIYTDRQPLSLHVARPICVQILCDDTVEQSPRAVVDRLGVAALDLDDRDPVSRLVLQLGLLTPAVRHSATTIPRSPRCDTTSRDRKSTRLNSSH